MSARWRPERGRSGTVALAWSLGVWLAVAVLAGGAARADDARRQALAALIVDDPVQAELQARDWLREASEAGDLRGQGYARHSLGAALRARGRYDLSAIELEAAIAIARRAGDEDLRALSAAHLGVTYSLAGMHGDALAAYQAAAEVYRAREEWQRLSAMLTNLGNALSESGNDAAAELHYRQSLELKREHGIQRGVATVLANLGEVARDHGDVEQAVVLLREAIAEADKEGDPFPKASALSVLAEVLAGKAEFAAAEQALQEASALVGDERPAERAQILEASATVALARAELGNAPAEARSHLQAALAFQQQAAALAGRIDDPARRARLAELASRVLGALGRWQEAAEALRRAHQESEAAQQRLGADRYAVLTARYLSERDQRELAELRRREAEQSSALARQRGIAFLLTMLVFGSAMLALQLWRRARERRQDAQRLQAHVGAIERALDDAETTRQRAQHLAALNHRLLQLAGDELRSPSLQIRNTAERLLVERADDPPLARQMASVAQAANELMRTAEQMIETAQQPQEGSVEVAVVDVAELARAVASDLSNRLRGGARPVLLQAEGDCTAAVDGARLQLLMHELVQIAAELNPGNEALGMRVYAEPEPFDPAQADLIHPDRMGAGRIEPDAAGRGQVVVQLDDPRGGMQRALARGEVGSGSVPGSLGLHWLDRVLRSLGGELVAAPEVEGLTGSVLLRLPRTRRPQREADRRGEQG